MFVHATDQMRNILVLNDNLQMNSSKDMDEKLISLQKSSYLEKMVFNFFQDISVIGLKNCFDKSRSTSRRLIWALLIILGVGVALYQTTDRISYFVSYPTSTDINMINADELDFPQVTICNENAARMSIAAKYNIVSLLTMLYPPLSKASISQQFDWSQKMIPNFTSSQWEKVRQELAQPIEEVYYSCTWGAKVCNWTKFRKVQTNMGQCFAILASDFNFTVTRAGSFYGLTLALFVNQKDYLGTTSPSAGFRLLLHDPEEFPLMQESAIKISPGFITSVSVTYNTQSRLPYPYGPCIGKPGYYQTDCIMSCEARYVYSKCDCKFYYVKGFDDVPFCTFKELYLCAQPALYAYNSDLSGGSRDCDCPPQCRSNTYALTISQNIFSDRFLAIFAGYSITHNITMPVNLTKQILSENYAAIQVYFSTLQYISITSNPAYSFMALLSDVGGALGLLLGATILTFVEIAEFGWELLKFWYITRLFKPSKTNEKFKKKKKGYAKNKHKAAIVPVII